MIKHIVMWNIKEDLDLDATRETLKEKLEALLESVESLKEISVGFNYNDSEAKRDIVLMTSFLDKAGLDAYIVHPAHIQVGQYVRAVTKDRVVVDYEY
ncbi:Stress responsive protein [Petrocella atlantisensis]|uniref:Stress responsive protein n=1 Tax=Petrocella atlantisensis TaxID=2173034 RepID=A0A3P7RW43_9FIRM|nr:Dabb family protein [Petrocella atlantisensis]MCF8019556.1 Dabb family protein [Vallitaleaceae bacterium]VDN46922.1 Stress responsive protein [Petrocella atlantisensis]